MSDKIKVLIVDDSPTAQKILKSIVDSDPDLILSGMAGDPFEARELIKVKNPDVITLDIEMPKMDGLTFLKNLMRLRPTPVIMCSSLNERGSQAVMTALQLGAIDCIKKMSDPSEMDSFKKEMISKIKSAASANIHHVNHEEIGIDDIKNSIVSSKHYKNSDQIIAIGASTGGIEALFNVIPCIPKNFPPIVIAQHIPFEFSKIFSEKSSRMTEKMCVLAEEKMIIENDVIYVAPGGKHLTINKDKNGNYFCHLINEHQKHIFKPSVDILFESFAEIAGPQVTAAILTGMGADGAKGLLKIKEKGGNTIAQDKETSTIFGMPKAAIEMGGAEFVLPLKEIPKKIVSLVEKKEKGK